MFRPVRRLLIEAAQDAHHLFFYLFGHAGGLDLLLEGAVVLLFFALDGGQLVLKDAHLLLDRGFPVGVLLRIVPCRQIELQIDGALEAHERVVHHQPPLPEGARLEKIVPLLLGHVEELAEHRGEFVHRVDFADVFQRVLASADLARELDRDFFELLEELLLPVEGHVHDLLDRLRVSLKDASRKRNAAYAHLLPGLGVQKEPHGAVGDVQDLAGDAQIVQIVDPDLLRILLRADAQEHGAVSVGFEAFPLFVRDPCDIQSVFDIGKQNCVPDRQDHLSCHLVTSRYMFLSSGKLPVPCVPGDLLALLFIEC